MSVRKLVLLTTLALPSLASAASTRVATSDTHTATFTLSTLRSAQLSPIATLLAQLSDPRAASLCDAVANALAERHASPSPSLQHR
jgi:hypothetical protein